jgi:hypothetical protein
MRQLHEKLHLQHHRHTGRRLHHKHTSYHGLMVLFVLAGTLMLAVTALGRATADTFSVGATVKAPIPSSPAIITSPSEGDRLGSDSQVVTGSCPIVTPQAIVAIVVDNENVGSAICDGANDFALPLRLSPGTHTVIAQVMTITGDTGPASTPLHITFTPGSTRTSATVTSQPNGPVATPNPLVITSEGTMLWLGDDKTATWVGTIGGGTPPYKVLIDWGDGTNKTSSDQGAGAASFDHTYTTLQPYNMSLSITDANHVALHEQFAVASFSTSAASLSVLGSATTKPTSPLSNSGTILGLYGLYLTAVAVFGIAWIEAKHAAKELKHAG